jgi:hypothetical protein
MYPLSLAAKNVFILYLIISSNFLPNLFGCEVQYQLAHSMLLRHFLGFLTVFFFVSLVDQTQDVDSSLNHRFLFAIGIYTWFILSTRMHLLFWFVLIGCLGGIYIAQIYKENELKKQDPNQEVLSIITSVKHVLTAVAVISTIVGFTIYLRDKRVEYGSSFRFSKFLIGVNKCKSLNGNSPDKQPA